MGRAGRWSSWLLPGLLVALFALRLTGVTLPDALLPALVIMEALLTATFVIRLTLATRSARRRRVPGEPWESTLEATVAGVAPIPLVGLVVSETRVFVTLGQWLWVRLTRQPVTGFSSHRTMMLAGWVMLLVISGPAEVILLHIIIPWTLVRWLVHALELYGLLWLFAIGASFGLLRHRVEPAAVRLRLGLLADVTVPLAAISRVAMDASGGHGPMTVALDADHAVLSPAGRTNLLLESAEPVMVRRLFGPSPPVRSIRFFADDPLDLLAAMRHVGIPVADDPPERPVASGLVRWR